MLSDVACDQMQGFLMSRPLPDREILAFLHRNADWTVAGERICAEPAV
jgi:diguanylate cyclase